MIYKYFYKLKLFFVYIISSIFYKYMNIYNIYKKLYLIFYKKRKKILLNYK